MELSNEIKIELKYFVYTLVMMVAESNQWHDERKKKTKKTT